MNRDEWLILNRNWYLKKLESKYLVRKVRKELVRYGTSKTEFKWYEYFVDWNHIVGCEQMFRDPSSIKDLGDYYIGEWTFFVKAIAGMTDEELMMYRLRQKDPDIEENEYYIEAMKLRRK